jgi:hypothetical protein
MLRKADGPRSAVTRVTGPACRLAPEHGTDTMRLLRLCTVAALALAISACGGATTKKEGGGDKPGPVSTGKLKDDIVGKWAVEKKEGPAEMKIAIEFKPDGKCAMSVSGKVGDQAIPEMKGEGTYKVTGDDEIETTIKNPMTMKEETDKMKITIKGDEMTAKDVKKNETMVFKKVK